MRRRSIRAIMRVCARAHVSVCLSVCLSVSLPPSPAPPSLSLSIPLLYVSPLLSHSMSSPSLSLHSSPLSHSLSKCLYLFISVSVCLCLCLCFFISGYACLSPSLSFSFPFSVSVFQPVSPWPPRWPSGKASASRAEGPGFESRLSRDFFGVESYQWLKNWHPSGYPARRLAW